MFHTSRRIGPFYISTWNWERQHDICCRGATAAIDRLQAENEALMTEALPGISADEALRANLADAEDQRRRQDAWST